MSFTRIKVERYLMYYDLQEAQEKIRYHFIFTTAGYSLECVCYEQRSYVNKILDQVLQADYYFGIVFTIDKDDNPLILMYGKKLIRY